jgi:hypothetical protein
MAGHLNKQAADGSTSDNLVDMRLFALLGMPVASVGNMSARRARRRSLGRCGRNRYGNPDTDGDFPSGAGRHSRPCLEAAALKSSANAQNTDHDQRIFAL